MPGADLDQTKPALESGLMVGARLTGPLGKNAAVGRSISTQHWRKPDAMALEPRPSPEADFGDHMHFALRLALQTEHRRRAQSTVAAMPYAQTEVSIVKQIGFLP